jgi:hypothetical protein
LAWFDVSRPRLTSAVMSSAVAFQMNGAGLFQCPAPGGDGLSEVGRAGEHDPGEIDD